MNLRERFRRWRKPEEYDVWRPLSEEEQNLVDHEVAEHRGYGEAPSTATPESPLNDYDVEGPDLPLSEGERKVVEHDVDEWST
jgi:hypothetical protein